MTQMKESMNMRFIKLCRTNRESTYACWFNVDKIICFSDYNITLDDVPDDLEVAETASEICLALAQRGVLI